jgi:hypothetical protein
MSASLRVHEFLHAEVKDNSFHSSVSSILVAVSLNNGLSNDYYIIENYYIIYVYSK